MKQYEVIGVKRVDFTDQLNKRVCGVTLHLVTDFGTTEKNVEGNAVYSCFVNEQNCSDINSINVGDTINLYFNEYKKVVGFKRV